MSGLATMGLLVLRFHRKRPRQRAILEYLADLAGIKAPAGFILFGTPSAVPSDASKNSQSPEGEMTGPGS